MTRLFEAIKVPSRKARGDFCDRVCKPGSVIDSHLSRRIVAGALQPPPRKQPGRPCFLHGVAPDRVYSNGRFHADACALTARFHPYLVRRKKLHILRSAAKRHCSYIPFFLLCRQSRALPAGGRENVFRSPPLPSKQGLCRLGDGRTFSFAVKNNVFRGALVNRETVLAVS